MFAAGTSTKGFKTAPPELANAPAPAYTETATLASNGYQMGMCLGRLFSNGTVTAPDNLATEIQDAVLAHLLMFMTCKAPMDRLTPEHLAQHFIQHREAWSFQVDFIQALGKFVLDFPKSAISKALEVMSMSSILGVSAFLPFT